jgi:endoglucanase
MFRRLFSILIMILFYSIPAKSEKIDFWKKQKGGTNIFNKKIAREDIIAAKKLNISFVRLMIDKFESQERDFLVGNADKYTNINEYDLALLKDIIKICTEENMPVVISISTLPGSRWLQNNNFEDDLRVWISNDYQNQALKFWQDLAKELKDYPIVIGYNILNEPHPERLFNSHSTHIEDTTQKIIQEILFIFYKKIITAIRCFDNETPIIIDSSRYADPQTFEYLIPQNDNKVIYSFHMYEPYEYTNKLKNNGILSYPGIIVNKYWNKKELELYMQNVIKFQQKHNIPNNKILVGEFGAHRTTKGIENYFSDLIDIFNKNKWHYAFYSFREDNWDGMDYELGSDNITNLYLNNIYNNNVASKYRDFQSPTFMPIAKNLANLV